MRSFGVLVVLFVVAGVIVVGAGVGAGVVGGIDRDVVVVVVPLVGEVVLEGGEGLEEDAVGRRAGVDAGVGDVDLVAVLVGVGAVSVVTVFSAAREDEGDASRLSEGVERVEEGDGRALEVLGVGHIVCIPRRVHAVDAAPLVEVALAEVGADGVGVSRGAAARCGLRGDDGRQVNRGRDGRSRRHGRERGDLGFDLGILAVAWLGGQMALHGGRCGHGGVVLDHGGGAVRQGSLSTMRRDVCGDGGRLDGWRG